MDLSRVYRRLLRLYPASFREAYSTPMEQQLREERRELNGKRESARFWGRAFADLFTSLPREFAHEIGQDARFAVRGYLRRPLTTVLAVLALALSIGVTTGVFSVVNALLLRSLPFQDPSRLVELQNSSFNAFQGRAGFSAWRARAGYLTDAATFSFSEVNFDSGRNALRVNLAETSANFFSLLGTHTVLGRSFAPDEDDPAKCHVAVLSYALWQQVFGGDPAALGATIHLDGVPLTVIGVEQPNLDYPNKASVWTPTIFQFETTPRHGAFMVETIGRLKPGVRRAQAEQAFRTQALAARPSPFQPRNGENAPVLVPLADILTREVRRSTYILAGIVLLVLVAACANVAQLLLARASERQDELALRTALGASLARIVQQLTTEAVVLTLSGALLGLAVAFATCRLAASALPPALATQGYSLLDWRVLLFAMALALVAGGAFGVIPGWLTGRIRAQSSFSRVQPGARRRAHHRAQAAIICLQVAITLILTAGSFALGAAFLRLLGRNLGYRPANVVTLSISLQGTKYTTAPVQWAYYASVLDTLRTHPGVRAAGAVGHLPLTHDMLMVLGLKLDSGKELPAVVNGTMPGYFTAMGTRLLAGADFRMSDGDKARPVIVNADFARQVGLPYGALIGRHLISPWSHDPYIISGVVETARIAGPEFDGGPQVYWPVHEEPPVTLTFVVRTADDPAKHVAELRDAVSSIDHSVPLFEAETLQQRLDEVLARSRFYTLAVTFLGLLALLLSLTGIYGAAAYMVEQRRRELGVRLALGARPFAIRRMVLTQILLPVTAGLLAGALGANGSGRVIGHLLTNATALGWPAFAGVILLLLAAAALASWTATARILGINPIEALKAE